MKKLETVINTELKKLDSWLIVNRLALNIDKTNFLVFHPYNKPIKQRITLKTHKKAISETEYIKGITKSCYDPLWATVSHFDPTSTTLQATSTPLRPHFDPLWAHCEPLQATSTPLWPHFDPTSTHFEHTASHCKPLRPHCEPLQATSTTLRATANTASHCEYCEPLRATANHFYPAVRQFEPQKLLN